MEAIKLNLAYFLENKEGKIGNHTYKVIGDKITGYGTGKKTVITKMIIDGAVYEYIAIDYIKKRLGLEVNEAGHSNGRRKRAINKELYIKIIRWSLDHTEHAKKAIEHYDNSVIAKHNADILSKIEALQAMLK